MTHRARSFEVLLRAAIEASSMQDLPTTAVERLVAGAVRLDLPAGATVYRDADEPRSGLVLAGLVRVFMTSPQGRQVTVCYARPGDVLGVAASVGGPVTVSAQAVLDSSLAMLSVHTLETLAHADARVAWWVAEEVTRQLYGTLDELAGNAFLSVRQRVARHLLDLAIERQEGRQLSARVSQQDLANATASVREVVTRVLRQLRDEGIVETSRDEIVLVDPARLASEALLYDPARDRGHRGSTAMSLSPEQD